MKSRLLALLGCCLYPLYSQQATPAVEEVLPRVQQNLAELEAMLPDFLCNEKLTSKVLLDGTVTHQTFVSSLFTGVQRPDRRGLSFVESREIAEIDGKRVRKGRPLKAPFFFGGGFSSVLMTTFAPRNTPYQTYRLTRSETVEGRPAWVIEFATREHQTEIAVAWYGKRVITRDTGKAWIDAASLQVVRLERRFANLPPPYEQLNVAIDYARVVIDGKTFWMPRTVSAEEKLQSPRHLQTRTFLAEYANYRKFDVSVGITFQ